MKYNEISDEYNFLCDSLNENPQLSHASNICTKYERSVKSKEKQALEAISPIYKEYLSRNYI